MAITRLRPARPARVRLGRRVRLDASGADGLAVRSAEGSGELVRVQGGDAVTGDDLVTRRQLDAEVARLRRRALI